ncbi:MAG TPA: LamG-like jellyroll fold domain-containing protein, partial [Pyrinomonadaceae bacterium]|nr:LamG-like jellyroll fold domain-containing protein [Pyrinomonadaceae bacterium]
DSQGVNNGTLQGGATYTAGRVGQAFNFPIDAAHVSVPDSPSLRPTNFTVEGWFNFADIPAGSNLRLFAKTATNRNSFSVFLSGDSLYGITSNDTNFGTPVIGNFAPVAGQWYHIAYSWQSGGSEALYVNGVAIASNAADVAPGYASNPLIIGDNSAFGDTFRGKVDEFSIYNRALTTAEIGAIYSAGSAGKCVDGGGSSGGCVRANYQFQNTLASSTGTTAPPLSYIGTGQNFTTDTINGVSRTVLSFPAGSGVELRPTTGVIANNEYEIYVHFKTSDAFSWNRLVDFKDGSEDGIYIRDGYLKLYGTPIGDISSPTRVFTSNNYATMRLTRTAAGVFRAEVNGVEQFSVNDPTGATIIGGADALRFFRDNGGEHYAGAVAQIRLSNLAGNCDSVRSIAGQITNGGTGVIGATVNLTGDATTTVTTDANGNYLFDNLAAGGDYTVTPALTGYTFTPANLVFDNLSANVANANFTVSTGGECATADYQFQNTLASSIGNPPALSYIGTGQSFVTDTVNGVSRKVLSFPAGNSVELRPTTGVIPSTEYEIVMQFKLSQVYNYTRLLDFKDGADFGLYVTSGGLNFYGASGGPSGAIQANTYAEVKLTRTAAGIVKGYVNGVEQFSFNDTSGLAVISSSNALRFFRDDAHEHHAGAVARIKLSGSLNNCNPTTYTIGGRITNGSNGLGNVSVALTGGATATATTDANGNYSFANLAAGGNYTVTPTLANFTFTPVDRQYNLNANVTNADFAGTATAPLPDLTIGQTASPNPVAVGQALTYHIFVNNFSSVEANGITVRFTIPAGTQYQSASAPPSGLNCCFSISQASGVVTFSSGTVRPNSTATLSVTVVPQSAGTLTSPGGNLLVDPNNTIAEANETNNAADDYVITVNNSATASTGTGQNVTVTPTNNLTLNFDNVINGGTTTATVLSANQTPALPANFVLTASPIMYDITTTAAYSGNIVVT